MDRIIDGRREVLAKREAAKKTTPRLVPAVVVIFVVVMVIAVVMKGRGSRGSCVYDHVYRKATCRTKQLTSIPADVTDTILTLHIGSKLDKGENHFTVLAHSNISRFSHLQELKLVKSGIEEIQVDTFASAHALKRLDLRYNRIQTISEGMFRGLTSLEYLYLSNNPIRALGDFVFRGLRIEHLVFGNNVALAEISTKAFAGAIVKTLVLNRCSLTVVNSGTLTYVADSLQELYITNNIHPLDIEDKGLQGLNLQKLTLAKNGLTDADFLEHVSAEEINLDDNPLEEIDFDDSPKLNDTKRLSLARTKLTKLAKNNLSMFFNLEDLDLEGNDIAVLNATEVQDLDSLKVLDLSSNDLELFDGDFSEEFPNLESLFLDGNDIQTLPAILEPLFSRLNNLTLHDNPLHCNCELRWFAKWIESHRDTLHELHALKCDTPDSMNLTQVSDYGFQCRAPVILNATYDTDGISLVCTAGGDPAPEVTWISPTGEERSIVPSRSQRRNFQTQSSLTVTKVGNYTCVARNVAGVDRVEIDTRKMPTSGLKFAVESREIEILQTPQGLMITLALVALLGYVFKTQGNPYDVDVDDETTDVKRDIKKQTGLRTK